MVPFDSQLVKAGTMRSDAKIRRERIIDAACDLLRTTPESLVTLESVAARADVGIATLYRNFPTRSDLDVACGLRLLSILGERIETTRTLIDADPKTHWDHFVWGLLDYGVGPLVNAITADHWHDNPELAAKRVETIEAFQSLLDKAAPAGLVPQELDPLGFAAEVFVVTRPLDGKVVQHAPGVQRRLLGRLLTAWRCESELELASLSDAASSVGA